MKFIEVTDNQTGAKLTVNTDNIDYILNGGKFTLLVFGGHNVSIRESYDSVKGQLNNFRG